MSDPVAKTPIFTQELEKTRQKHLNAISEAHEELTNDQINDESQKEELEALEQNKKSLELYPPKVKEDGKVETTQEYKARVRKELETEKKQLEENRVTLSEKNTKLTEQETVLSKVNGILDSNPTESLRQAGFSDEEREDLQSREKRIAEQEKLQALQKISNHPDPLNEKEIEDLKKAGFSDEEIQELHDPDTRNSKIEEAGKKLSALEKITKAEDEKLEKAGLNPDDLKTEDAITKKLEAIKEQKENLTKVQEALEARQKEVKRLQTIKDTPDTNTNGTNNDSNPQTPPNSNGGCQGGNCGRQARRGRAKATIMAVAATELAALQIDYSQFLS